MSDHEERLRRALHMIDQLRIREALATIRQRIQQGGTMAEARKFVVTIEADEHASEEWPIRAMMVTLVANDEEHAEHLANEIIDQMLKRFGETRALEIDATYEL